MTPLTSAVFDAELVRRYTTAGPRYTSYPPAPYFSDAIDSSAYRAGLGRTQHADGERPVSLYVHLPFCKSVCRFCACNVHFTKDRERAALYVDSVIDEMRSVRELLAPGRVVDQMHWGGGTPTFLEPQVLEKLAARALDLFEFSGDAELSVEIDPREVDEDRLRVLTSMGFRRFSIGVQDFDPRVQESIHRRQPADLTRRVIDRCRELGAQSINIDLMYGLPHQTNETFRRTLETVLSLEPDRLALFNFAYLPEAVPHQRAIDPAALPEAAERWTILSSAVERLCGSGMVFVGMDHFARPEDELAQALEEGALHRNFQGYTTRAHGDLLAFGASAIGLVGDVYVQNLRNVDAYELAVGREGLATARGHRLDREDRLRRDVIAGLFCRFEIDKGAIESAHGIDFDQTFREALEVLRPMEDDGLVRLQPRAVEVLPQGRFLVRNIAMAFDAYRKAESGVRYSTTV